MWAVRADRYSELRSLDARGLRQRVGLQAAGSGLRTAGRTRVTFYLSADDRLDADDLAYIGTFGLAHSSLYSGLQDQLAQVRQASGCLSFDFSDNWVEFDWQALIQHVDIAFFSAAECSSKQAVELANSLRAMGPAVVVITRGAQGAIAVDARGTYEQPALPCTFVDSMGAGDGFIAAFLLAWRARQSLADCLSKGVGYAGQVCGWAGGFGQGQATRDGDEVRHCNRGAAALTVGALRAGGRIVYWSVGEGLEVRGPVAALLMALTRRPADGVVALEDRAERAESRAADDDQPADDEGVA
mgnify:CR=1 FL=1